MTLRRFIALFAAAILSVAWSSPVVAQDQGRGLGKGHIKNIYVFGDSLSDTGNLFTAVGGVAPASPPYFDGRFSNGPVWVEYLDKMLPRAELHVFAFGGAFSGLRNAHHLTLPGVLGQVAHFVTGSPPPKPRDLCIVWSGANNYIFEPVMSIPASVVGDASTAIQQLAWAGCQNFLVPNLPDIGETPFATALGLEDFLAMQIEEHNRLLADELDLLRQDLGVEIVLLDINTLFGRSLMGQMGFVNSADPCLDDTATPTGACPVDDAGRIASVAPRALFMDPVHPTTAAHRLIAAFAFGALAPSKESQIAAAE